jgi:hypothetical protein
VQVTVPAVGTNHPLRLLHHLRHPLDGRKPRGLGDGYLQLDWDNDGTGYRSYHFTPSPAV